MDGRRVPPVELDALSPEQQAVADSISGGARGSVRGPFLFLLQSPELASRVEQLGEYLRYRSRIPTRQRELAILAVSRHWRADYEWFAHAPLAAKQGVAPDVLSAIGAGEEPKWEEEADGVVFRYVAALLREGVVPDALYRPAAELLGDAGVVDLTALAGYYTLLALVLNGFEAGVPDVGMIPWRGGA